MIVAALSLALGLAVAWPLDQPVLPRVREQVARISLPRVGPSVVRGLAAAVPTALVTRWPVAATTAFFAANRLDAVAARARQRASRRERRLAIAGWAETLQGMYLAGHGVEDALALAAEQAPPVLRPFLLEAEALREHAGPAVALQQLGAELDDRNADLLILNLLRATEGRSHNLPEVLGLLAASTRRAVAVDEEVEAAQAKPRRTVVLAGAIFAGVALYLRVMGGHLARYYDTAFGQFEMGGLIAWFGAGLWQMARLGRPLEPDAVLGTRPATRGAGAKGLNRGLARVAVIAAVAAMAAVVVRGALEFVRWAVTADTFGVAAVCALFGTAIFWLKDAVIPPPQPLDKALMRLRASGGGRGKSVDGAERAVRRLAESLGLPARIEAKYRTDLRLVGETLERHLAVRFMGFAIGALAMPALAALAFAVGMPFPFLVPVWVSPLLGLAGFLYVGRSLASRAGQRRESLRYALISFLYSAASAMKSGQGREDAVEEAANAGDGWAFAELRAAHWDAWALSEDVALHFDRLGKELGSEDLRSIAASLAAGGDSGARIADALVAKARSMQDSVLSAAKARSAKASEDMDATVVVLVMMPIVAFLALPAVAGVQGL